jgi:hypothetical protein
MYFMMNILVGIVIAAWYAERDARKAPASSGARRTFFAPDPRTRSGRPLRKGGSSLFPVAEAHASARMDVIARRPVLGLTWRSRICTPAIHHSARPKSRPPGARTGIASALCASQ